MQRKYDKMEEISEILLTQIASHPLLLEKEAEKIMLVEVEVDEEAEEIVMVNQTPRSNQLLEEEENNDLVEVKE